MIWLLLTLIYSEWVLAGGGVGEAGGRAYWVWRSGEGWVFIGSERHCDKLICAYVHGVTTVNQT